MMLIFVYVFLVFTPATFSKYTYQLIFKETETLSHAKLFGTIDHRLVDYTVCHWSKINVSKGWGAVFSYNNNLTDDLILTMTQDNTNIGLWTSPHSTGTVATSAQISDWLHVCFTRTTVEGRWAAYVNGYRKASGKFGSDAKSIPPNGVVILGQNQDVISEKKPDRFVPSHYYVGQIAEVHLWDYVLPSYNITQVFTCTHPEGNVIAWNQRTWELHNGALISMAEIPCGRK